MSARCGYRFLGIQKLLSQNLSWLTPGLQIIIGVVCYALALLWLGLGWFQNERAVSDGRRKRVRGGTKGKGAVNEGQFVVIIVPKKKSEGDKEGFCGWVKNLIHVLSL